MHFTGCLGMVHLDDPERWYGEGGGRWVIEDPAVIYVGECFAYVLLCLLVTVGEAEVGG